MSYIEGRSLDSSSLKSEDDCKTLSLFLNELHSQKGKGPSHNTRGRPLQEKQDSFINYKNRIKKINKEDHELLTFIWSQALDASKASQLSWLHGDLHQRNVLINGDGKLSGVIDWGDFCHGDPANDLACLWMFFNDQGLREKVLDAYFQTSDDLIKRAKGWAAYIGTILIATGEVDHPVHAEMGRNILDNLYS